MQERLPKIEQLSGYVAMATRSLFDAFLGWQRNRMFGIVKLNNFIH